MVDTLLKIVFSLVLLLSLLVLLNCSKGNQLDFKIVWGDNYDRFITLEEEIVVPPVLIDFVKINGYLAGIRLAAYERECDNKQLINLVSETTVYFLLDMKTGKRIDIQAREEFINELSKRGIAEALPDIDEQRVLDAISFFRRHYNVFNNEARCKIFHEVDSLNPEIHHYRLVR